MKRRLAILSGRKRLVRSRTLGGGPPRPADRTACIAAAAGRSGMLREGHNNAASSFQPVPSHGDISDGLVHTCTNGVVTRWSMAGLHYGRACGLPHTQTGLAVRFRGFVSRSPRFLPASGRAAEDRTPKIPDLGDRAGVWSLGADRRGGISALLASLGTGRTYLVLLPVRSPIARHGPESVARSV